jgi:hypothetical protein
MEDVGGTNRKQAPHSPLELEDITVMQRFFYVCFSIRVPNKQTKWTLKFQLIERCRCWDEKGIVLHVPELQKQWNPQSGNTVQLK